MMISSLVRILVIMFAMQNAYSAGIRLMPIRKSSGESAEIQGCVSGCFLNSGSVKVAVHVDTNGKIKAFDTLGANTEYAEFSGSGYGATACMENNRIIVSSTNKYKLIEFTLNSNQTQPSAFSYTPSADMQNRFSLYEAGTTIVYMSRYSPPARIMKFDYSAKVEVPVYNYILSPSVVFDTLLLMGNNLYAMGTVSKIIVLDKTSMTETASLAITNQIKFSVVDDTTADHFFYTDYDGSNNYFLSKADVSGGPASFVIVGSTSVVGQVTNLVSIPTTNLLLISTATASFMSLYDKASIAFGDSVVLQFWTNSSYYPRFNTLALLYVDQNTSLISAAFIYDGKEYISYTIIDSVTNILSRKNFLASGIIV